MAELYEAVNKIIGIPGEECGFRYYVNWSVDSTPGEDAPHQINVVRKIEAQPPIYSIDPTKDFPGIYIDPLRFPNVDTVSGTQYMVSFLTRVYYVAQLEHNSRPSEVAREMIVKVTENIMSSDKLGLDFVSSLRWTGITLDTDISRALSLFYNDYCAAAADFELSAVVRFGVNND